MMMVDDNYTVPRLEHLLTRHVEGNPDVLGILYIVQLKNLRQPWRRCAAYRVVYCLCKQYPEMVRCCPAHYAMLTEVNQHSSA